MDTKELSEKTINEKDSIKQNPSINLAPVYRRAQSSNEKALKGLFKIETNKQPIGAVELLYHFDHVIPSEIARNEELALKEKPIYATIELISIENKLHGKGYGRASYEAVINDLGDVPLVTKINLASPSARRVWNSLIRDGLAREIWEQFSDGTHYTIGYISIPTTYRGNPEYLEPYMRKDFEELYSSSIK
jgi:hypothetical protein